MFSTKFVLIETLFFNSVLLIDYNFINGMKSILMLNDAVGFNCTIFISNMQVTHTRTNSRDIN